MNVFKIASDKFSCGDRVREPEGRHHARVEAMDGVDVKVRWFDSGWVSTFHFDDLLKDPTREQQVAALYATPAFRKWRRPRS